MTKDECFYIGRITKPFGVKGQVIFFLDVDDPSEYAELDSVLVETKNGLVPYFIEELNFSSSNKAIVTFEDLTPDESASLVGRELYLPLDVLPKLEGNKFYFHEVEGFEVVDVEKGPIGRLETVIEYPAQPLFQIMNSGKEILIPVIDEVIKNVDRENKTLLIEAPKGLIDLYLEDNNN
ncbi:MAG: ribosome maturation factor RimM [Bacteroidales bacterium]|nr:ribosome maturation factor RimM [Bacteroidales bacterium]